MPNKTEDNYYAEPDWDTLEKRIEELIDEPEGLSSKVLIQLSRHKPPKTPNMISKE